MKLFALASLLISFAHADVLPPQTQVIISGKAASAIADLKFTGADQYAAYSEGKAKFSCVKKANEEHYTCVIKLIN